MRKKNIFLIVLIIIAIGILTAYIVVNRPVYGNSKAEIIKVISKDDNFINENEIEIFDIVDMGKGRLVAYSYNDLTCIAEFIANEKGNYEINSKQWTDNPIQTYQAYLGNMDYRKIIFVYSGRDELSKIKIEIQGENYALIERDIEPDKASIIVVDLEGILKNKDNYSYGCKYYDKNGNEIY